MTNFFHFCTKNNGYQMPHEQDSDEYWVVPIWTDRSVFVEYCVRSLPLIHCKTPQQVVNEYFMGSAMESVFGHMQTA